MRMIIPFLAFWLVATCNAELRTWTAVNGKEVEAEFVSNEKGIVKLKLKSGKVFEVAVDKLSKEDNDFIISFAGPDGIDENELTMDQVLKIANQPHQPIIDIPQLITAKLKVGMWESERTIDVHESSLQKAKIINRKSLKRIKHVNGKYVVVQTYDENGNKVFTEVHSYNTNTEKLISVGISATGKLMRMIGTPDLKNRSIQWVKQPSQSDQILQILIICSQDGKSLQIKGSDKVGKEIIASWKGKGQWKSKSPSKETTDGKELLKFLPLISDADVERFAKDAMHYDSTDTTDYTGWTKVVYEGQLVELVQWKNGQPDGFSMLWYTNGQIAEMSLQREGEQIQFQAYYKTGEKKMLMRKGIASRVWHKNGKKAATMRGEPFTTSPSLKPLDPQSLEMKFWNDKGEEIDLEEGLKMLDEMMEEQYGDTIESEDEIGAETEAE